MTILKQTANISTFVSNSISLGVFNGGVIIPVGKSVKLNLNGRLVSSSGQVSFVQMGYASNISFEAAFNLTANVFTVVGTFNGQIIRENIIGPNGNTVYTNNLFHTIISVNVSGIPIAPTVQFAIGCNQSTAVVLEPNVDAFKSNLTYSVLISSIGAAAAWAAGGAIIYGVTGDTPTSLQISSLTYATRSNNYFSLPVSGAALTGFTVAQLNNGINIQTNYPYVAVIVYLAPGTVVNTSFIEIAQS